MILTFLGITAEEEELASRVQRFGQGTYLEDIARLQQDWSELRIEIDAFDATRLHACLDAGEPVLVYLQAMHLSSGTATLFTPSSWSARTTRTISSMTRSFLRLPALCLARSS
jgi:hypothetical protein